MTTKFFPLLFFLTSCIYDPPRPRVEIVKNSKNDLTLELGFDRSAYKSNWSEQEFQEFLNYPYGYSYPGPEAKLISFDPEQLVQVYTIPSKGTYSFSGWGNDENSVLYDRMKFINNRDTMTLADLTQIKRVFRRIDKYTNRLELK